MLVAKMLSDGFPFFPFLFCFFFFLSSGSKSWAWREILCLFCFFPCCTLSYEKETLLEYLICPSWLWGSLWISLLGFAQCLVLTAAATTLPFGCITSAAKMISDSCWRWSELELIGTVLVLLGVWLCCFVYPWFWKRRLKLVGGWL